MSLACPPIAGHLTRIDRGAAAATRVLHDRRLRAGWQSVVDGLAFLPMAVPPADVVYRVSLETAHGPVEGYVSAPDHPSLAVAAMQAPGLPAALLDGAAEAALQPVLDALASLGLADVGIGAFVEADVRLDPPPTAAWVRVLRHGEPLGSFVCTRAPDAVMLGLRERLAPPRFTSRLAFSLALPGRVQLSVRPVRRAVLDTLAAGDVLLLASGGPEQRVACHVSFGARAGRRWRTAVAVEDTFITLQGAGHMIDDEDHDRDGIPSEEATASPPADLAVPVHFEVDTLAVPLAQIESMGHGYVIELAAPLANAPVRLVACGRVIGVAELVAVGDRLGARITHLAARDAERSGH